MVYLLTKDKFNGEWKKLKMRQEAAVYYDKLHSVFESSNTLTLVAMFLDAFCPSLMFFQC